MTRIVSVLNEALLGLLREDERVFVLGESIEAPYNGAFKVTKDLSTEFPARVMDTPISEGGLTGLATGMALRGMRPVVEIMFGDFVTLCVDQVLNAMTKFRVMFGQDVPVPVVIRTPMGGRRGYGATHSQTLEKLFVGVPHLDVVAASPVHDVGALLRSAVLDASDPTLFLEHKLLYAERVWDDAWLAERSLRATSAGGPYPTITLSPVSGEADVTVVSYGGMAPVVMEAVRRLSDAHVHVEVVLPSLLSPLDAAPIVDSVHRTGSAVVAEEGTRAHGWGAEVSCRIREAEGTADASVIRVAARDHALPSCRELEARFLPQADDVEAAILDLV